MRVACSEMAEARAALTCETPSVWKAALIAYVMPVLSTAKITTDAIVRNGAAPLSSRRNFRFISLLLRWRPPASGGACQLTVAGAVSPVGRVPAAVTASAMVVPEPILPPLIDAKYFPLADCVTTT